MTFTVINTLPDGREHVLARGLTLDQVRDYVPPARSWAITYRQE